MHGISYFVLCWMLLKSARAEDRKVHLAQQRFGTIAACLSLDLILYAHKRETELAPNTL
jgi:hypothetical protein